MVQQIVGESAQDEDACDSDMSSDIVVQLVTMFSEEQLEAITAQPMQSTVRIPHQQQHPTPNMRTTTANTIITVITAAIGTTATSTLQPQPLQFGVHYPPTSTSWLVRTNQLIQSNKLKTTNY